MHSRHGGYDGRKGRMKFKVYSEVIIDGVGKCRHEHIQEFSADSNVFGRALEYREYMHRTFPKCEFRLLGAEQV